MKIIFTLSSISKQDIVDGTSESITNTKADSSFSSFSSFKGVNKYTQTNMRLRFQVAK